MEFGISGMKHFIISNDKKIVGKMLKDLELANQKDNKLTLVKFKFSMSSCENEIKNLSKTAQNLFHVIHIFGENEKMTNFVNVLMPQDPIQKLATVTCGPFQLPFYENPFFRTKTAN